MGNLHFNVARTNLWKEPSHVRQLWKAAGSTKSTSDFLLLKNFIFQSEKGTRDERAEPKLKQARAIMCSLAVSAGDNTDHLLLTRSSLTSLQMQPFIFQSWLRDHFVCSSYVAKYPAGKCVAAKSCCSSVCCLDENVVNRLCIVTPYVWSDIEQRQQKKNSVEGTMN